MQFYRWEAAIEVGSDVKAPSGAIEGLRGLALARRAHRNKLCFSLHHFACVEGILKRLAESLSHEAPCVNAILTLISDLKTAHRAVRSLQQVKLEKTLSHLTERHCLAVSKSK